MIIKFLTISLFLSITISSCSQNRTHLSENQKKWNPYKSGQLLIFESSNYLKDTLKITDVDIGFPDGLGVVDYNESLFVLAKPVGEELNDTFSNSYGILKIVAKTRKKRSYIEYRIELKDSEFVGGQQYYFEELGDLKEIPLTVDYGSFDDVIIIGNKRDYSKVPSAIEVFYWSKSKGYIRFDKYDGTTWELVNIIEPKN